MYQNTIIRICTRNYVVSFDQIITNHSVSCSEACSIDLKDTVVVSGGCCIAIASVHVYNIYGHHEQLPDMLTARYHHGCAQYVDSENRVVSIPIMWQFPVQVRSSEFILSSLNIIVGIPRHRRSHLLFCLSVEHWVVCPWSLLLDPIWSPAVTPGAFEEHNAE